MQYDIGDDHNFSDKHIHGRAGGAHRSREVASSGSPQQSRCLRRGRCVWYFIDKGCCFKIGQCLWCLIGRIGRNRVYAPFMFRLCNFGVWYGVQLPIWFGTEVQCTTIFLRTRVYDKIRYGVQYGAKGWKLAFFGVLTWFWGGCGGSENWGGGVQNVSEALPQNFYFIIGFLSLSPVDWHPG